MLYKKDFEAIAEIIRQAKEDYRGGTPAELVLSTLDTQFADYLATQNPHRCFDRSKFLAACGLD